MSAPLRNAVLSVLSCLFVAITVMLFVPEASPVIWFSFYPAVILAVHHSKPSYGVMLAVFATLLGFFCWSKVPPESVFVLPTLIMALWAAIGLIHFHHERLETRVRLQQNSAEDRAKQSKALLQEISFYEEKKKQLQVRSVQRKQLVTAARDLGSSLDPAAIQQTLLDAANKLFPTRLIQISLGQNQDQVDAFVIQKAQPLMVPTKTYRGHPLIAAPIMSQGSVAGVLRVGGQPGPEFSRDDLRLLDILASLASLSLENSVLFTQVQETALRDNLTGLWTHRAFDDQLEAAILEASRYGQPLSIILTDVDHFKSVNDTHGHQAGDAILQGFAHVMARNVRDVDVVSRYGGEEFIVLLLNTPHASAIETAEAIRQDLQSQHFDVGGRQLSITGSFGVASFPNDATSAQQLVRVADQRMYAAKKAGRNKVLGQAA